MQDRSLRRSVATAVVFLAVLAASAGTAQDYATVEKVMLGCERYISVIADPQQDLPDDILITSWLVIVVGL